MIKVFQIINNPYKMPNPFVYAIIDGVEEKYTDIKWGWGIEKFWNEIIFEYDIVLCQWPDVFSYSDGFQCRTTDNIKKRIQEIKSRGIKFISFVHNLEPHYSKDEVLHDLYNIIYSSADALIHMGQYSKNLLSKRYPQAKHFDIGPHYIYNQVYKRHISREQGCFVLGLEPKYKYILAFGAFRDEEERILVSNLAHDIRNVDKRFMILAPSFTEIRVPKFVFDIRPRIRKYLLKHRDGIICNGGTFNTVPDALLPYYYAAADICFIHRKKILNSGNVPMGFLMSKVVAGPDVGNVGDLLRMMGNPCFDANDRSSVADAITNAFHLTNNGKGKWNHNFAMENFSTATFCKKLHDIFKSCMEYQGANKTQDKEVHD